MVFRDAELEYDNFELLRGQSHVIKVTQRSIKAGKKPYHLIPPYVGFCLGDKCNGSICFDIRGQHDVLKVNFEVIRVSKSTLGASPAVYTSRIPRANQDEQNPPPRQSTQKPQQKQACGEHQRRHSVTRPTIHDNARQRRGQRLHVCSRECRLFTVPIQTWRPKKWPKAGLAILLGSRLSIRL